MGDLINGRTPEEIKQGLWRCLQPAGSKCVGCPYESSCVIHPPQLDALDLIRHLESERDAALAKVTRWIKLTEESKPRDTGFYVVLVTKHGLRKRVCFYDSTADDWWLRGDCVNGFVTHWVSGLPEPPEEE